MKLDPLILITTALADPGRVRILACLRGAGEVCACHIIELLALAPSTVSKHMAILRGAGLVEARKDGRWMHYRLAGDSAPAPVRGALEWVWAALEGDPVAAADARRLRTIVSLDAEVLCCGQRECGPGSVVPPVALPVLGAADGGCCSSAPATPAAAGPRGAGPKRSGRGRSTRGRRAPSRRAGA